MTLVLQDTLVLSPATAKKLEQEIEDIKGATDCADVVGTYAELEAYDTSKLTDQAIVKVLQDESRNNAQTYYRWSAGTETFTLLGELGPYYTKQEADTLYNGKQNRPSSAVQNNIATFNNTKDTVDSGKAFTTSVAASSSAVDTKIPTEKAVRTELDTKVDKNNAITGATKTKITYDSKGLVTAGADLVESDIPSLHLTKISDVTATATELNYVDGVTSSIQTQLDNKVAKTSSASKVYGTDTNGNQTTYNKDDFGKVDDVKINNTSIVNNKIANITIDNALNTSSTNAVQNGVVATAINNKSGVVFKTWSD